MFLSFGVPQLDTTIAWAAIQNIWTLISPRPILVVTKVRFWSFSSLVKIPRSLNTMTKRYAQLIFNWYHCTIGSSNPNEKWGHDKLIDDVGVRRPHRCAFWTPCTIVHHPKVLPPRLGNSWWWSVVWCSVLYTYQSFHNSTYHCTYPGTHRTADMIHRSTGKTRCPVSGEREWCPCSR